MEKWSFGNTAESAAINNLRMQIEPKARFKHVRNTSGPMFGKAALPQLLVAELMGFLWRSCGYL